MENSLPSRHLLFYLHGILTSPGKEEAGHTHTAVEFHRLLSQQLRQLGKEGRSLAASLLSHRSERSV